MDLKWNDYKTWNKIAYNMKELEISLRYKVYMKDLKSKLSYIDKDLNIEPSMKNDNGTNAETLHGFLRLLH